MARWSVNFVNWTGVAVADTTNFTNGGYCAYQGGTATQTSNILEVFMGGLSAAAAASAMVLARDSTVGTTLTVGRLTALNPATAALSTNPIAFQTATTVPQRSATLSLLMLAFNAFGGIVRWVAAPGEEIGMLGNAASFGETSLSVLNTGSPGILTSHFIVEPA
jgi:hypothetical protein